MRKIISIILLIALSFNIAKASIFSDILDFFKEYATATAKVLIFSQDLIDVASYPNDYIKKVNQITRDINSLKTLAINSNLGESSLGEIGYSLHNVSVATAESLKSFTNILGELTEFQTNASAGISQDLGPVIKSIKESHEKNMRILNDIHSEVYKIKGSMTHRSGLLDMHKKFSNIKM